MLQLDTVRAADNHESSWTGDVAEVVADVVVVVGEAGNIRKKVLTSEQSRDWVDRVSPGMTKMEIVVSNKISLFLFWYVKIFITDSTSI